MLPTGVPTGGPSVPPTAAPTHVPTTDPTGRPTVPPTSEPTALPSTTPTAAPTSLPTSPPTSAPTGVPTTLPSPAPTATPVPAPTPKPIASFSVVLTDPTQSPTAKPTRAPTPAPHILPAKDPPRRSKALAFMPASLGARATIVIGLIVIIVFTAGLCFHYRREMFMLEQSQWSKIVRMMCHLDDAIDRARAESAAMDKTADGGKGGGKPGAHRLRVGQARAQDRHRSIASACGRLRMYQSPVDWHG